MHVVRVLDQVSAHEDAGIADIALEWCQFLIGWPMEAADDSPSDRRNGYAPGSQLSNIPDKESRSSSRKRMKSFSANRPPTLYCTSAECFLTGRIAGGTAH